MLIIMSGLPGTGKTTIARELARRLKATHLRVDTIAQALISSEMLRDEVGPADYIVAYALAEENLRNGGTVIADSVNAITITRQAWRNVASRAHVEAFEIHVTCSDAEEHRRRVETRVSDIEDMILPTWKEVAERFYEKWDRDTTVIDTFTTGLDEAVSLILGKIESRSRNR
ncbi:AAA family ATPase [Phyllobacterium sp. P30BS-XVII]|uniref:AAA family ATPase n=1 Tax=Phyllobacterium sp. P30BS-XVII TaxID=2587046 RepID=UPI0015F9264A|nr:AAA family ATPase [Phyllobacterium sp. P30BS-XVII]MBA8902638.1 putative kinase [Phyllobacterium sp. P30BS-XVII]